MAGSTFDDAAFDETAFDGTAFDGIALPRRRLIRGIIGTGAVAAGGVLLGGVMGAQPANAAARPVVYTREQWRAQPAKHSAEVLNKGPDHIVIHHTASANTENFSLNHAFDLSRQIQHFHMQGRGWDDIGEQLTISRGGFAMEGRNHSLPAILAKKHAVGAHTLNHNSHTLGIENEGNYMTAEVPAKLWSSLVGVCAWLCTVYDLDPFKAIVGHRDYNDTDCPGDVLYQRLPELRKSIARKLEPAKKKSTKRPAAKLEPSDEDEPSTLPEWPRRGTGLPHSRITYDHGPAGGFRRH